MEMNNYNMYSFINRHDKNCIQFLYDYLGIRYPEWDVDLFNNMYHSYDKETYPDKKLFPNSKENVFYKVCLFLRDNIDKL
jgi:hypothetical protein